MPNKISTNHDLTLTPDEVNRIKLERVRSAEVETRRAARELQRADVQRETLKLRARLEEENGLIGHPKAELLWQIIWDRSHHNGLSEVENAYDEMAELLK